jgi:hypothetical protein
MIAIFPRFKRAGRFSKRVFRRRTTALPAGGIAIDESKTR